MYEYLLTYHTISFRDDEKQTAAVEGAENEAGSSGQGSQAFDPPQTVGRLHIANAGK